MVKLIRLNIIPFLFSICFSLHAQDRGKAIHKIIDERGETYVSVSLNELKKKFIPNQLPGFDKVIEDSVFLYLTLQDSIFIKENKDILRITTPPSSLYEINMSDNMDEVLNGEAYPTYPLYLDIMQYFRDKFPEKCSIDTIGRSVHDRLILAARLGNNNGEIENFPVGFYSSTMHGDEIVGFVLMLILINHFLEENDPGLEELMNEMIVVINPLENPDGTYFTSDTTVFGSTRGNSNGVNLNRNYPDPQDGSNPDGNERQPESEAMMKYLSDIRPSISANFHSGAEVVNYPFDTWEFLHADNDWFRLISSEYADLAISKFPGYMSNFPGGITNGYQWYEVNGGRQDYVTYFLRGRETTIELSRTKLLPESEINAYWEANKESMINYLRQGLYGLHGNVKDSISNAAIKAEIELPGHDIYNSSVFSDSISGNFYRYLKAGNYTMRVSAENYLPVTIESFSINDYEKKDLNISLLPASYIPDELQIKLGPNPFYSDLTIYLELDSSASVHIKIYDIYGQSRSSRVFYRPEGFHDISIKPDLPSGMYFLELRINGVKKNFKIIKAR